MKTFSRATALTFMIALLWSAAVVASEPGFTAWLTTDTLKIFPDTGPVTAEQGEYEILAVRNEFAPFQIAVFAPEALSGVEVELTDFTGPVGTIPASSAPLYLVETVTIEKPSIDTDRRVWPDPLPPYHSFDIEAGKTKAVWADLFVPEDAVPGRYNAEVLVSTLGGQQVTLPLTLEVRDVVIPTVPTLNSAFGISYSQIGDAHGVDKQSPEFQALKEKYYWFMIDHRVTPYYIPVDFFSDAAHTYLDDPRVNFLRAPFSWDEAEMRRIADRLLSQGWIDKAVFYKIDEPSPARYAEVVKVGQWLHSFNPDLRMIITAGYNEGMKDADIQIWCPVLFNTVDKGNMKSIYREVAKGKKLWWYTCIGPKWKGMNYFIDEAATAPRALAWMNHLYGVTGILYWQVTSWGRVDFNPWEKTETYPDGNGDGSLLYPGSYVGYDGPVASIRMKMVREGMEDYELISILGRKLDEAVTALGGRALEYNTSTRLGEHALALVTPEGRLRGTGIQLPHLMYVTTDYQVIEDRRKMVIDEIEQALKSPLALVSVAPGDMAATRKTSIPVSGFVENGAAVMVNGVPASVEDGAFSVETNLEPGENAIVIEVSLDGKTKILRRTVFRK